MKLEEFKKYINELLGDQFIEILQEVEDGIFIRFASKKEFFLVDKSCLNE